METKRVLITGGAGFIGSHLCEKLLTRGDDVICLDNMFTGRKDNIRHLIGDPHFEFIRRDVLDPINVECDEIYNLACPASPVNYDAVKADKISVVGAFHVLDLAKRCGAKVLQAEIYEDFGNVQASPNGVPSGYEAGRDMAETLFFAYHSQYNVDIKIARIFNTYGPRMRSDDGRVVSNFIVQALKNEDITIYGDGKQTRSFCYVDDLVEGMVRMMNSREEFHGPVNIGNPREFTMLQLAELIIKLTGSKSRLVFKPLPSDDPLQRKPVIDLAKKELDWEPTIPLEEGLKRTIEYFKNK